MHPSKNEDGANFDTQLNKGNICIKYELKHLPKQGTSVNGHDGPEVFLK